MRVALAVLLALLLFVPSADAATRHTLIIGANRGLGYEPELEFAQADAERIARALREIKSVAPEHQRLLTGKRLKDVRAELGRLARRLGDDDEVWVFISAHADAAGAHLNGEIWPWAELRSSLATIPARRRLLLVDACNSGAVLTAKGIHFDQQLRLSTTTTMRGLVILASSGANELSYESRRLGGSPFAHFLVSGLRGAADSNRDQRVTLSEIYTYVYQRTVAASLGGATGPQHPAQAGFYHGSGDWVLSAPHSASAVSLHDASLGTCYVLDDAETFVLGEIRAAEPPLSLRPGSYRVKCFAAGVLRAATLQLNGAATLDALAFEAADPELVIARGDATTVRIALTASGGIALGEPGAYGFGFGGLAIDHGPYAYELQLGATSASRFVSKAALYGRLPWWAIDESSLDVGLTVGLHGDLGKQNAILFGPVVQLSVDVTEGTRLFVRQEILRSIPLSESETASLPLFTSGGVAGFF